MTWTTPDFAGLDSLRYQSVSIPGLEPPRLYSKCRAAVYRTRKREILDPM